MPLLALTALVFGTQLGHVSPTDPNVYIPPSSVWDPSKPSHRCHTNIERLINSFGDPSTPPIPLLTAHGPVFQASGGYTPNNIRGAYNVTGTGSGVIVIVDAFDFPTALPDFNTFSAQYGLPQETSTDRTLPSNQVFQVVYADSTGNTTTQVPSPNASWNEEAALDIEWAHAMAPNAKIVLVEAIDNSWFLYEGILTGSKVPGVREISLSWGEADGTWDIPYDAEYFTSRSVQYFAASGDVTACEYPSTSPNVIACGGTTLTLSGNTYVSEGGWGGTGGGSSTYEPIPSFQVGLQAKNGFGVSGPITGRATPDISAVADPNTGVWVYDSAIGWKVFGGTSVATPILAGIHNSSSTIHRSSEWFWLYNNSGLFHDVVGPYNNVGVGYDYMTGIGSPITGNSL